MTSAFVQTVQVNGLAGLWRGLTANLLKVRKFLISGFSRGFLSFIKEQKTTAFEERLAVLSHLVQYAKPLHQSFGLCFVLFN